MRKFSKVLALLAIAAVLVNGEARQVLDQARRKLAQFSSAQPFTITWDTKFVSFTFPHSTIPTSKAFYHVAVDTDASGSTGFTGWATNVGAEFMIESENGVGPSCTKLPSLYKFTGTPGSNVWTGSWTFVSNSVVSCAKSTSTLTWKLPLTTYNTFLKQNTTNVCQTAPAVFDTALPLSVIPVKASTSCPQGIMVPAYWDASQTLKWDQVFSRDAATATAPRYVIINPSNGDGDATLFATYKPIVARAKIANVGVLGYVYTKNGQRNQSDVLASINKYYDVLNATYIKGIFLDEANVMSCTTDLDYYKIISSYIKSKGGKVVLNPGMYSLPECFFSTGVADMAMVFEDTANVYANKYIPTVYQSKYKADRFIHAIYSASVSDAWYSIRNSKWRGAGWIYVTDDGPDGNPWDSVASYWTAEAKNATLTAV